MKKKNAIDFTHKFYAHKLCK